MTTRLPVLQPMVLEDLRIATPCLADWNDMVSLSDEAGDERVRFCGKCEKNVYNVIAMSRAEAEALVREKEGQLCVRLFKRSDGTVLTADCPVGVRRERLRSRMWATVSKVAASAGLVLGLLSGRARADLTVKKGDKPAATQPPIMMAGAPYVAPKKPAEKPVDKPPEKKAAAKSDKAKEPKPVETVGYGT